MRDEVFGAYDFALSLAGVVHLAYGPEVAELGLSVVPEHRRRGVATALVERAVMSARKQQIRRLYMHCLAGNEAVLQMARRAGVSVVVEPPQADGYFELARGESFVA